MLRTSLGTTCLTGGNTECKRAVPTVVRPHHFTKLYEQFDKECRKRCKQMIRSLTFQDGNAEQAMNFYVGLFENSHIVNVTRWALGGPVEEGKSCKRDSIWMEDLFMCSDSPL